MAHKLRTRSHTHHSEKKNTSHRIWDAWKAAKKEALNAATAVSVAVPGAMTGVGEAVKLAGDYAEKTGLTHLGGDMSHLGAVVVTVAGTATTYVVTKTAEGFYKTFTETYRKSDKKHTTRIRSRGHGHGHGSDE